MTMPHEYGFDILVPTAIDPADYLPILALGMLCALVGIAIMRGVTLTEEMFRRSGVPVWLRPAIGGLAVGLLALVTPQVLSSGHAALQVGLDAPYSLEHIALLIAAEGGGVGDLDRVGVPRRAVLCLAVPGRAGRQAVRRLPGHGDGVARGALGRLCDRGHERARGRGRRRPADHGVPGAGEHRQPADDGRGGGGLAWSRR